MANNLHRHGAANNACTGVATACGTPRLAPCLAGLVESGDAASDKRAAPKAGAPPSFAIVASTAGLPAGGFDAAVSSLVLCSVDDVRESACELYRWLKPGGTLLFLEHVADGQQARAAQLLARRGRGLACKLLIWG